MVKYNGLCRHCGGSFLGDRSCASYRCTTKGGRRGGGFCVVRRFLRRHRSLMIVFFAGISFRCRSCGTLRRGFGAARPPPGNRCLRNGPPSVLRATRRAGPGRSFRYCFSSARLGLVTHRTGRIRLFSASISRRSVQGLFSYRIYGRLGTEDGEHITFFFSVLYDGGLVYGR